MTRINWGHGILIFFILYVGYLVGTVIKSRTIDHSLVIDNYYEHDIAYQKLYYDATENRKQLKKDLAIIIDEENHHLNLEFGDNYDMIKGEVLFYRPSDKKADITEGFQIYAPQSKLELSLKTLRQGRWVIKIRWNDGQRDYYKEKDLII